MVIKESKQPIGEFSDTGILQDSGNESQISSQNAIVARKIRQTDISLTDYFNLYQYLRLFGHPSV